MSAATGKGEQYPRVCPSALNFRFERYSAVVLQHQLPGLTVVDLGTFSVYLIQAFLTKVPDLFSKSIQQYRSHRAQVAKL